MPDIPETGVTHRIDSISGKVRQDKRRYPRYLMYWSVSIYPNNSTDSVAIVHGTTSEISKNGASVLSDRNIMLKTRTSAMMQLTIPPLRLGQHPITIEIPCSMIYSYLDSTHNQFRIGIDFMEMTNETRTQLEQALSARTASPA